MSDMPKAGELWKYKKGQIYYFVTKVKEDGEFNTVFLDQLGKAEIMDWRVAFDWLFYNCEKVNNER